MKIKKLKLHNLTAIEDAEIDFLQPPLSETDIFLITGNTGSGKTSILDGISLALYGEIPRIKANSMQGDVPEGTDNLKITDPRQLLRKNSTECVVSLWFEGNNGNDYESVWSVNRAHFKLTGKIQQCQRKLVDHTNNIIYTHQKDIKQEIYNAIGLDYEQFCRTCMLAQGEFTKFLYSNNNDKSIILEKITGLDIYSRIGIKTFEKKENIKNKLEIISNKIEAVKFLDVAEKESLQEEQVLTFSIISELNKTRNEFSEKVRWKRELDNLTINLKRLEEQLAQCKQKETEEKYITYKHLTSQIEKCSDIIPLINQQREIENQLNRSIESIIHSRGEYEKYRISFIASEEEQNRNLKKISELESSINESKKFEEIYKRAGLIKSKEKDLKKLIIDISEKSRAISKLNQEIELQNAEIREIKEEKAKTKSLCDELKKDILSAQKHLQSFNIIEINKEKTFLLHKKGALQELAHYENYLHDAIIQKEKEKLNLEKLSNSIIKLRKDIQSIKEDLEEAATEKEKRSKILETLTDTVDKWAQKIRTRLNSGDICPVCRQKVIATIPQEEELSELYIFAKEDYEKVKKYFDNKEKELRNIEAIYNVEKKRYSDCEKSYNENQSIDNAYSCITKLLTEHNLVVSDNFKDAINDINELQREIEEKVKEIDLLLIEHDKYQSEINKKREIVEDKNSSLDKLLNQLTLLETSLSNKTQKKTAQEALIKQSKLSKATIELEIVTLLGEYINNYPQGNCLEEVIGTLNAESIKYMQDKEAWIILEKDTKIAEQRLVKEQEALQKINNIISNYEKNTCIKTTVNSNHNKEIGLTEFLTYLSGLDVTVLNLKERFSKLKTIINLKLEEKGDITESDVKSLSEYTTEQRVEIKKYVKDVEAQIQGQDAICKEAKKQLDEHLKLRKDILEDDTVLILQENVDELDGKLAEYHTRLGEIKSQLDRDAEMHKCIEKYKREFDSLRAQYLKWEQLCDLIGDSKGAKFRKIAQSYVLSSLIESANQYLQQLTDRYKMRVVPGQFTIMLKDYYQGGVERSAATISGGESFLVSLSLALALSDISEKVSTDILFIDEGFGTLSGVPLNNAIETLKSLHRMSGKKVGIISHVEELRERIPVQIRLIQNGTSGGSEVKIV